MMTRHLFPCAAGAALLLSAATTTRAEVKFDSASVNLYASAEVFDGMGAEQTVSDPESDGASSLPTPPLYDVAYASASLPLVATASDAETATSTFISAYSGTVEFFGTTSGTVSTSTGQGWATETNTFEYSFDTSSAANISINTQT